MSKPRFEWLSKWQENGLEYRLYKLDGGWFNGMCLKLKNGQPFEYIAGKLNRKQSIIEDWLAELMLKNEI